MRSKIWRLYYLVVDRQPPISDALSSLTDVNLISADCVYSYLIVGRLRFLRCSLTSYNLKDE